MELNLDELNQADSSTESNLNNSFKIDYSYPVLFTENYLSSKELIKIKASNAQVFLCFDEGFLKKWPSLSSELNSYFGSHLPSAKFLGGEQSKTGLNRLEDILTAFNNASLAKGSYVLAFGGGSFLDVVGLASSLFHRGLKLVRFPTTVLAQNDAGIGVKNGLNLLNQKNCIGTFAVPEAVINDFRFISTLPDRDLRSGIAEAIKVALLKDQAFFNWLYENRKSLSQFKTPQMNKMIRRCAELHLLHIAQGGDPFEQNQSRPLDYGHWLAHRLEVLSNSEIKHGEAVAQGILVDSFYSHRKHGLHRSELLQIKNLLSELGFDLNLFKKFDVAELLKGLEDFKNHLGGDFELSVLTAIGQTTTTKEIDLKIYTELLEDTFGRLCH